MKQLLFSSFSKFEEQGFFQEAFGYHCVDAGYVPGRLGANVASQVLLDLQKVDIWPIGQKYEGYSDEDVFDLCEWLHDQVSEPLEGHHHTYSDCGWHYSTFNRAEGKRAWREEVNRFLRDYGDGYHLNDSGEVIAQAQEGFEDLLKAPLPAAATGPEVEGKVAEAIARFRHAKNNERELRAAVRDLADVLEFIRPAVKAQLVKQDEKDLFNIINNYSIRHHNENQKGEYSHSTWHRWMFYVFLATVHACMRRVQRPLVRGGNGGTDDDPV